MKKTLQEVTGYRITEVRKLIRQYEAKGLNVAIKVLGFQAWIVEYSKN